MYNWRKRFFAVLLSGCLTLGLVTPAFAVDGGMEPVNPPVTETEETNTEGTESTTPPAATDGEQDGQQPVEGEDGQQPGEGGEDGQQPSEGGEDGQQPDEGGEDGQQPDEGGEDGQQPGEGGEDGQQPDEGGEDGQQPGEGENGEETDIPDGETPLDPGFTVPDYASMSAADLYEIVKDMSAEERAMLYELLTAEQIAALEAYEQEQQAVPPAVDYGAMSNEELYTYGMENLSVEERIALLDQLSAERRADFEAYIAEYEASLAPEVPEETESDYSGAPEEIDVGPIVHYETPVVRKAAAPMQTMAKNSLPAQSSLALYDTGDGTGTVTNGNGSITYDNKVTVNKTISDTNREDSTGKSIYKLDLSAEAVSEVVQGYSAVDIVLMLDLSDYMKPTTVVDYSYNPLGPQRLENLYNDYKGGGLYYKAGEDNYVPVTINRKWNGSWFGGYYTYSISGTSVVDVRSNVEWSDGYRRVESGSHEVDNLESLQEAVTEFIKKVYGMSPKSRIAIVAYADGAAVRTGSFTAEDEALVTVGDNYNILLQIVENLTVLGGASNSDLALADAVKIFQDVPTESEEYSRDRVALLFSAGIAGNGKFKDDAAGGQYVDQSGTGNAVAQGSMHLSVLLKGGKGDTVPTYESTPANVDWNTAAIYWDQNFYGEGFAISESEFKKYQVQYTGCGATVYTVGLNLQETDDPTVYDISVMGSDTASQDRNVGARINEYMYRISQHRPTSAHYTELADLPQNWQDLAEQVTRYSEWYPSNWGFYPDILTRNQTDGYFLTASSEHIDKLTEIFEQIASQVGESAEVSVIDYIDPAFTLVDQNGIPLREGSEVQAESYTGIVKQDANGYYIEWTEVTLDPGDATGTGAQKFNASIYVVSNDSSFGGNQVPTNISNLSGVSTGSNLYKFPEPNVNLPINYQVNNTVKTVPIGTSVDYDELITYAAGYTPNGTNNAHVTITYTLKQGDSVIGTYTIPAGQPTGSWTPSNPGATSTLTDCQNYTLECTVSPAIPTGTDSLDNGPVNAVSDTAAPKIHVLVPTITWKDTTVDAGTDANYTENFVSISWADKRNDDGDTTAADSWNVTYEYDPPPSTINAETPVDVTVKVNEQNITQYVTFIRTCEDTSHESTHEGDATECEFVIHLNNIELLITKNVNEKPEQSFIFTVSDSNDFTVTIAMGADEFTYDSNSGKWTCTKTLTGLSSGTYTVSEDTGWSWKYDVSGDPTKTADPSGDGNLAVTFDNTRNNTNWLGGSDSVENVFEKAGNASALLSTDADVPKKQDTLEGGVSNA